MFNQSNSNNTVNYTLVQEHGISKNEYKKILKLINRNPSITELGIFSAMWNEHCSYKSSKKWLKLLPCKGKQVICGPGENAGIIDIGDGQAVVFKMESHNHPSFIEPYQGAATGVGGILRDIFTMGARPIATMNSLSFGDTKNQKTKSLLKRAVEGIGGYGNSFGVPNVGGELRFDKSYNGNCLINVFAAGLVNKKQIFYSAASGIGMPVVYLGAKTGRDGVGGATMASAEFDGSIMEEKRPTVQVGDPFTEKRLMEACLELMGIGAVISIQDMGAAGLTCSAVEMGDKGNLGIELNLDYVPVREKKMTAYEIMLSESQERMLMVLDPAKENASRSIFEKWDLDFSIIGKTIKEDRFLVTYKGEVKADLPLKALSGAAPIYDRKWEKTKIASTSKKIPVLKPLDCLLKLLNSPNYCSRQVIWEQYDNTILGNTIVGPGSDAAIIRIEGSEKALAFTTDVTPRYCCANPYEGGKQAVAEAYRNLIASGAEPMALTDNLNFGNPENKKIMGQLVFCVKGIAEASRELNMPVVSGNVSLYNETDGKAIMPTPTIGAVGIINNYLERIPMYKTGENVLIMLGKTTGHINQSALKTEILNDRIGDAPRVNLRDEKKAGIFILKCNKLGLIEAAHDLSDGGLILAAAEMAISGNVGLHLYSSDISFCFAEDQSRYLLACTQENLNKIYQLAAKSEINIEEIGVTGGEFFMVGQEKICLQTLKEAYATGLTKLIN